PTELSPLSLHDALPIYARPRRLKPIRRCAPGSIGPLRSVAAARVLVGLQAARAAARQRRRAARRRDLCAARRLAHRAGIAGIARSEEHTSELQSLAYLV